MEQTIDKKDIEYIKQELHLIKRLLLASKPGKEQSLEDETHEWELLSDQTLEDFEDSLNG